MCYLLLFKTALSTSPLQKRPIGILDGLCVGLGWLCGWFGGEVQVGSELAVAEATEGKAKEPRKPD